MIFADRFDAGRRLAEALQHLADRVPVVLALVRGGLPVAPPDTLERLAADADEIVCLDRPEPFGAVGYFYNDFTQVSDQEVVDLLDRARAGSGPEAP
jgi:putative phosphoribosyl transferase